MAKKKKSVAGKPACINARVKYIERVAVIEDTLGKDGPYTGRRETITDYRIEGLIEDNDEYGFGCEIIPLVSEHKELREGKNHYLLYATYDSGDSFSRNSNGRIEFVAVFTDRDLAEENLQRLKDHHQAVDDWKRPSGKLKNVSPYMTTILNHKRQDVTIYVPWHGYFEHLRELDIKTVWKID